MNADDLVETVRTENNTALSRLGSSKTLFADTEGDLDEEPVLVAAATHLSRAADVLDDWAEGAGGDLAAVYGDAADVAATHADEIAERVDDFDPGDPPAVVSTLAATEGDLERAGGLLGWLLVLDQKTTQLTGYFTGQADPRTASVFRGFGDDYDDLQAAVGEALDARCDDEADWATARDAAAGAVQTAYEAYVDTLESLGVNPKPVC